MTTRDCLGTVAVGACLCLALGCRHQVRTTGDSASVTPLQIPTDTAAAVQGSSYHPRARAALAAREPQLARVEHAAPVDPIAVSPPPEASAAASSLPHPATTEQPPKHGPPLAEALRCLLQKQPEEARRWLEQVESPNRETLSGLLGLVVLLAERQLQQTDPQDVVAIQSKLENIQDRLRPRAALTVSKMRFCKWIEKYGDYEPLPDSHQFRTGDLVQVYVELRNVTCERQGPIWLTRLASSIEVLDAQGKVAWRQDLSDRDRPERSHTVWREYFRNYRFYVPDKVPPGLYTLRIQVSDVPTGRTVRGQLDFRVTTVPSGRSS